MQPACIPHDELARLDALRSLQILDSDPSPSFDRITQFVARSLDIPIVLVSLVDAHRQWFKSKVGLDASETPRDLSFCGHVVFDRASLVVPDATQDDRFADNPLVTGAPHVRAYMGVPLFTHKGYAIGTLCAIDNNKRDFSDDDLRDLSDYAKVLEESIQAQELNRATEDVLRFATEREKLFHDTFNLAAVGMAHLSLEGQVLRVNKRICEMLGYSEATLRELRLSAIAHPEDLNASLMTFKRLAAGELSQHHLKIRFRRQDGAYLWTELSVALKRDDHADQSDYLIAICADISAQTRAETDLLLLRDNLRLQVTEQTRLLNESNLALQREVDLSHEAERVAREAMRDLACFHHALDQHASVTVTDVSGVITYANQRFCELSGYTSAEIIGKTHSLVKSEEHARSFFEDMWRTILQGSMWRGELCNRGKDGRGYWLDACFVPYRNEAGQIQRFVSICVDISQRKLDRELLAAEELRSRQINERLRQIADSLPAMISYWDKDQICRFANAAHFDRFGLKPQQMIGMSAEQLLGSAWGESRRALIDAALGGERQNFDITGPMADLSVQHWQIEYIPHWFENRVVGFYSLAVNITERKRAEQTHARQEAVLAATGRMGEIGGWEMKLDAQGPEWSDMVYQIHDVPIGRPVSLEAALDFYPSEWRCVAAAAVEDAFGQARAFDFTAPLITAMGRHRWVRCIGEPQTTHGRVTHITGALQDITRQKLLEADLAQAQKLESIGQLSAGIAHEINTPTQFIGNNIGFLKDSMGDVFRALDTIESLVTTSEQEHQRVNGEAITAALGAIDLNYLRNEVPRAIEQSAEGIDRIQTIVSAMKEFSHPAVDKTLIDINRAIASTITVASNEWKYVATVDTRFDRNLPMVSVMPGGFNQVILNMIVNAAHAIGDASDSSTAQGQIVVSTKQVDDWVEVNIQDSGCGISDDVRARVFDPFFTTKPVGKGTGQGLAIAHDVIVNKHGGTISVKSKLGTGTTFTLRLPLQQANANDSASV